MRVFTGKVVGGQIEIEGEPLEDGANVTVIATESEEGFYLNDEQKAALLLSIAEADGGELVDAEEFLRALPT